jgi:hypothetical protein
MKAEEFDKIFDDNEEDIIEHLDLSTLRRPNLEPKKSILTFQPGWSRNLLRKQGISA